MTQTTTENAVSRTGWLYGPAPDLLFGCGVGYFLTVPILMIVGQAGELTAWPVTVAAIITMLTAGPHYGATILRVLEQREDRYKYAFFFFLVTAGMTVAFLAGLYHLAIGSWILTLYATWSPWHFAGQNYGLALMFLRRRQIEIAPKTKRLFHLSFFLSFLLTAFAIHTENSAVNYAPGTTEAVEAYTVLRLGIPSDVTKYLAPLTAALYLYCLVEVFQQLRAGRARALLPTAALVATQATWFTVPALATSMRGVSMETLLPFTVIWISVAHSVQYLWITSYYAHRANPTRRIAPYVLQATLVGSILCVIPWMLFAPGLLGGVPWDAGLALLVFSVINLHHFLLDGAIWKLRDGLVARALLTSGTAKPEVAAPRRRMVWPTVWTVGAIGFGISVFATLESEFGLRQAETPEQAQQSAERLKWVGREMMTAHANIGSRYQAEGRYADAIEAYRHSIELFPSADVWSALGDVHELSGDLPASLEAQQAALAIDPEHVKATFHSALVMEQMYHHPASIITALERVVLLAPGHAQAAASLARHYHDTGKSAAARKILQDAISALQKDHRTIDPLQASELEKTLSPLRRQLESLPQ